MPVIGWIIGIAFVAAVTALVRSKSKSAPGGTPPSRPAAAGMYNAERYIPHSPEAVALFADAARAAHLPVGWASMLELHMILGKESNGWVGIPNYQFGEGSNNAERARWVLSNRSSWPFIWDAIKRNDESWRTQLKDPFRSGDHGRQSSATGLGQMTISNLRLKNRDGTWKYGEGPNTPGNALLEAMAMLQYLAYDPRYGGADAPKKAWAKYGQSGEGY